MKESNLEESKRVDEAYSLIKKEQKFQHWFKKEQLQLNASFKKLCLILLFVAVIVICPLLVLVAIKLIERPANATVIVVIICRAWKKKSYVYDKISCFISHFK